MGVGVGVECVCLCVCVCVCVCVDVCVCAREARTRVYYLLCKSGTCVIAVCTLLVSVPLCLHLSVGRR